jgi:hypothetical protein
MPLKLNVGICKKVGQPSYGSLGASCNIEVELDQSLVFDDPEAFQSRVTQAYAACRQAVAEELVRQQSATNSQGLVGHAASQTSASPASNAQTNGNGSHRATQKQVDYAHQLAGQIRGLGARRLETLAQKMFAKPLADLSSFDASGLIDMLKDIKSEKIELKDALHGVAA